MIKLPFQGWGCSMGYITTFGSLIGLLTMNNNDNNFWKLDVNTKLETQKIDQLYNDKKTFLIGG